MPLTITPTYWAKKTYRFWTRGRSQLLQQIDTALDNYALALPHGANSAQAENALVQLEAAINAWKTGRGVKSNGNVDSKRDSKGLVTRLMQEVASELQTVRGSPEGKQRRVQNMVAQSRQIAQAGAVEREEGNVYTKAANGQFQRAIFTQEKSNSCTCACACTYSSLLSGAALKEEVLRDAVDRVLGYHHDFEMRGMLLDIIAKALVRLHIDATHVATGDYGQLGTGLRKATPENPVLFAVSWDPGPGAHAIICTGTDMVQNGGRSHPGFRIMDPWPDHQKPTMYDDGSYWVWNSKSNVWIGGHADPGFGYIWGKPGRV